MRLVDPLRLMDPVRLGELITSDENIHHLKCLKYLSFRKMSYNDAGIRWSSDEHAAITLTFNQMRDV